MKHTDAVVGDRVRCINDDFKSRVTDFKPGPLLNLPKKGEVYTIREIVCIDGSWGFRLEEIRNRKLCYTIGGMEEPSFYPSRFEPA